MADIAAYTDQIAKAIYGEEVRSSIIGALNKVNDDNNSYQQIKTIVEQHAAEIDTYVQQFDGKVQSAQAATSALETATTNASSAKTELTDTISAAGTARGNLQSTIDAAGTKQSNLQGTINNAGSANTTLMETINAAGTARADLNTTITAAGTAQSKLSQVITNAGTQQTGLEGTIDDAETARGNLNGALSNVEDVTNGLNTAAGKADETRVALENVIAAGGYVSDVQIGGASVVTDGVANLLTALRPTLKSSFSIASGSTATSKTMSVDMSKLCEADIDLILVHGTGVKVAIGGVNVLDTSVWGSVLSASDKVRLTATLQCRAGVYIKNLFASPVGKMGLVVPAVVMGYVSDSTDNNVTVAVTIISASGALSAGCTGEIWGR